MSSGYHYYIVGDSFSSFAKNAGVIKVSEAIAELRAGALDAADLTLGLGLSELDRNAVCAAAKAAGADPGLLMRFAPEELSTALTHKHETEHVMIGTMLEVGVREYECALVVNSLYDRLSDHVTGQHLGGMLLVEAARQAVIAAIELEYGQNGKRKLGLAWSSLRADFRSFAFPVPATLRVRLSEIESRSEQPNTRTEISVEQGGRVVSYVTLDITLFDAALLQTLEAKSAARVLKKLDEERAKPTHPLRLAG